MHPPLWVMRRETCKCISLEKTLPETLHFQRQAQLVKVTPYRQQDRNTLSQTCIDQPFTRGTDPLKLLLFVFWQDKNTAHFIGQYFVLIAEPRKKQWRHSRGKSCQRLIFLFLMWLILLMALFILAFASSYASMNHNIFCFFHHCD